MGLKVLKFGENSLSLSACVAVSMSLLYPLENSLFEISFYLFFGRDEKNFRRLIKFFKSLIASKVVFTHLDLNYQSLAKKFDWLFVPLHNSRT